jgi:hypothetical protein
MPQELPEGVFDPIDLKGEGDGEGERAGKGEGEVGLGQGEFKGGIGAVLVVRYRDTPVGMYAFFVLRFLVLLLPLRGRGECLIFSPDFDSPTLIFAYVNLLDFLKHFWVWIVVAWFSAAFCGFPLLILFYLRPGGVFAYFDFGVGVDRGVPQGWEE